MIYNDGLRLMQRLMAMLLVRLADTAGLLVPISDMLQED